MDYLFGLQLAHACAVETTHFPGHTEDDVSNDQVLIMLQDGVASKKIGGTLAGTRLKAPMLQALIALSVKTP